MISEQMRYICIEWDAGRVKALPIGVHQEFLNKPFRQFANRNREKNERSMKSIKMKDLWKFGKTFPFRT